jgi:malate/lactate dehydrogenase
MVSVLGAPPPAAFVVPWSEASIGGFLVERLLTPVQLTRLTARVERLWPPRPYTLGLAAATVAEGIVRSSRRAFNVLTILDGELGVRGRAGALPCFLDPTGIVASRVPSMSARERVRLDTALGSWA